MTPWSHPWKATTMAPPAPPSARPTSGKSERAEIRPRRISPPTSAQSRKIRFDTWISAFNPPPSDLTKLGDPDGDGRSNYEEYALGGDPRFHDAPPAQTVNRTGADIVWSFAVRDDAGIDYTPKRSPDLTQWFEFTAPQIQSVPHPDLADFLLITITATAVATDGKEFVRVEFVIP